LRFLDPANLLNEKEEYLRYELHENDIADARYQNYMQPIADWVARNCSLGSGLDFGCGKAPLLAKLLEEKGLNMRVYDPYYFADTSYRDSQYDFCVAVETAEHFYSPKKEIEHLISLLKTNGGLGFVTQLYHDKIDFKSWYYRLDPTHVCFYSQKTFAWIQNHFGFKSYQTDGVRFNWLA